MTVHILFTCRNPDLAHYSFCVFHTIRVGFPTATIKVWFNGPREAIPEREGFEFADIKTTHHEWIKSLVNSENEPFWICDTDVIFYESMEDISSHAALMGFLIPEWSDEFTRTITRSRLHTALMRIDPITLRKQIADYQNKIRTISFINPHAGLFSPQCVALHGRTYFYDVCSMLYHAVGGVAFTDEIKDRYFHFNFGTISDLVLKHLKDGQLMAKARQTVLDNPELGHGAWRIQEKYYSDRQYTYDGHAVIEPISEQDAKLARDWNIELCCANQDAMTFCDLWHHYCHGIDDLVDTMQDGRPKMSKQQSIGLFFHAALLYNCEFFIRNRSLLFPIILDITNIYQVSVHWERAPQEHLRKIGDVFRTCGNRMYSMVALITGGEQHMLKMTQRITERDYLSQHDVNDKPI